MNQYLLPFFSLFIAFADSIHGIFRFFHNGHSIQYITTNKLFKFQLFLLEARRLNCHYIGVLEEERGQKKEEKKAAREWYHSDVDIDGEGR